MKTKVVLITLLLAAFLASTASARVPRKNPTEFDKGTTAYDKQQYQQAIDWMDKVLDQNPDNGYALAYKGSSLRYLKRLDEAVTALDRAATLIDDVNTAFRAWTNSERFYALVDQGDTIAALQAIDLAIQDDGNNPVYWTNRAVIKAGQGNLDEAIADSVKDGIKGKATTPYLLAKVKDLTGGDSLASNIQLVYNNAALAARTACAFCALQNE